MTATQKKKHTNNIRGRATRRSKSSKNPFRRVPSYILWGLLTVVVVVYVIFLYQTFVRPYSYRWKAVFTEVKYPDGKVRGIDVSHYQDEIDWKVLSRASIQGTPVDFIFVKATEGSDKIDECFNQNFYNARKYNIIRGAYHFYSTKSSAERQARLFSKIVQLEEDDLPPVLDVETIGSLSKEKLRSEVLCWLRYVEKRYGAVPILYTNRRFKTDYLDGPEFDKYPFWIAHYYEPSLKYEGKWAFWQHTDVGKVQGIKGKVDINLFNGTYEELVKMTMRGKGNGGF